MQNSVLSRISNYLLILTLPVACLFFLPLTPNIFTTPKQLALTLVSLALFTIWGVSLVKSKTLNHVSSPLNLPLVFFVVAMIINIAIHPQARLESILGRGSIYLIGAVMAYFASIGSTNNLKKTFIWTVILASGAVALHGLLQLTWVYNLSSLPLYMQTKSFTLTGSPLISLVILLVGAVTSFYYATTTLKNTAQYFVYFTGTLTTIALVAYISLMLPGSELSPLLLPYQASWAITLETFKSPANAILGVGFGNFTSLYSAVKPLFLNSTAFWNNLPTSLTSEFLHLTVTGGLLVSLAFLYLLSSGLKTKAVTTETKLIKLILLTSTVLFFLIPLSTPMLVLIFIPLGLLVGSESKATQLTSQIALTLGFLVLALVGLGSYYSVRVYAAEMHSYKANQALEKGDGKTVYEEQISAIRLLPGLTIYRLAYSQVNLNLASSLSNQPNLTEENRQQIATLVSQAIREAKVSAQLSPKDPKVWQNLGSLYRNLVGVADGADNFAVNSYAQAITLDPANPVLRLEFAGLLYQLSQKPDQKDEELKTSYLARSITEYQTAIQLKNDYASAYYNLSHALESAGNHTAAYQAMARAVASLDPGSPDLTTATGELDNLKKAQPSPKPSSSPTQTSDLVEPSPLPSPIDGGPIDLPSDSSTQ